MLDHHAKIALKFSGGKDSLSCLEMLRPILHKTMVIWVNTGATYKGFEDYINEIGESLPHFMEVKSDQPEYLKAAIPSDICPTKNFPFAMLARASDEPAIVPWFSCCDTNLWQPLHKACLDLGVTCIVTGQKLSDIRKNSVRSGQVVDGIEYHMPLENMTDEQVFNYLEQMNVKIPSFYETMETSPDCWDCTAFLDERKMELASMKKNHPDKWAVVSGRISMIQKACEKPLQDMRELM